MAVNTSLIWMTLYLCITGSNGKGELTILHSPDSLNFTGSSSLRESMLKDLFLAALGLSINETSKWKGMTIYNPFNIPEAVVEVYVDGVTNLGDMLNTFGQNYPIDIDDYQPNTFQIIKHTIFTRYPYGPNKIIAMHLSNDDEVNRYARLFGRISQTPANIKQLHVLTIGEPMDEKFLSEINVLNTITEKINAGKIKSDNKVDFYTFRVVSLHQLSLYYGKTAGQTIEAKEILMEALRDLTKAFVKAYKGAVLVAVVTTDVCHTRRYARSPATTYKNKTVRLDDLYPYGSGDPEREKYLFRRSDVAVPPPPGDAAGDEETGKMEALDPDLPLRTNLLLWFTITYIFVLITVLYLILGMQPDRDSIIYRMTTSRAKKEH